MMNYFGDFLDKQTQKEIEKLCKNIAEEMSESMRTISPKLSNLHHDDSYHPLVYIPVEEYKKQPVQKKPPKKRTKEEILILIDAALAGRDREWFKELSDELKGVEG